jgi:hypothetical protein
VRLGKFRRTFGVTSKIILILKSSNILRVVNLVIFNRFCLHNHDEYDAFIYQLILHPFVKTDNLIVTRIYFSLLVLGMWFCTFPTMSWAQGENETAGDMLLGNVTNSNVSPIAPSVSELPTSKAESQNASSYINMTSVVVKAGHNNSATTLCDKGDLLVSGGYDVQFKNAHDVTNIFIYANHPTGNTTKIYLDTATKISTPSLQEGWETGLLNNGNNDIKVTAQVLCANVQ